jgi:hypothetical protein
MTKYPSGLPKTRNEWDEIVGALAGLMIIGLGALLWWSGGLHDLHKALSNSSSSHVSDFSHVLEVHCVTDSGFDDNNLCLKPDRFGAELEFRVKTTGTEKVLITIVKNDGNYGVNNLILDDCSVFDASNWTCRKTVGKPEGIHWVEENGMSQGRYYRQSISGGNRWPLSGDGRASTGCEGSRHNTGAGGRSRPWADSTTRRV